MQQPTPRKPTLSLLALAAEIERTPPVFSDDYIIDVEELPDSPHEHCPVDIDITDEDHPIEVTRFIPPSRRQWRSYSCPSGSLDQELRELHAYAQTLRAGAQPCSPSPPSPVTQQFDDRWPDELREPLDEDSDDDFEKFLFKSDSESESEDEEHPKPVGEPDWDMFPSPEYFASVYERYELPWTHPDSLSAFLPVPHTQPIPLLLTFDH